MTESIELLRLREFKKESGWSFSKIANLLHLHPQTLHFWWEGSHSPSTLAKERILLFLNKYSYKKEL
ncbi:hypothetical protein ES703_35273 [subsurface metagenome]